MVSTRGSRLSADAPASTAQPATSPSPETNVTQKATHAIDDEPDDSRQHKKRRTESGSENVLAVSHDTRSPGRQVEEELTLALSRENSKQDLVINGNQGQGQGNTQDDDATENGATPAVTQDTMNPEVAAVISNIMDHSERVEEQFALNQQQSAEGDSSEAKDLVYIKANSHLKSQSLPILDNLSTQILALLAKSSYQEIISLVSEPDSDNGQAYSTMRSLFDHTKKVYSTKEPFLSAADLDLTEPAQVEIIRKANLASFVSSVFGAQEIGFSEMNDHFLETFVPDGSRLLKVPGALFLELKTQAFIASMNNTDRTKTELLHDLFPDDLEQRLLARRPGTRQLAPSEADFVKRARSRRDILLNEINNPSSTESLPDKYRWEDFLRDLSLYISKNFEAIANPMAKKGGKGGRPSNAAAPEGQETPNTSLESQFSVAPQPPDIPVDRNLHGDLVARAARAAQIALQGQGVRLSQQGQQQQQPQQPQAQPSHQLQHTQQQVQQTVQPGLQHQSQSPPAPQVAIQPGRSPSQQGQAQHSFHHSPTPPAFQQQQQQQQQQTQPPGQYTFHQSPLQANFQQYNPISAAASITARAHAAAANYGYMPGVPHHSQSQPTQILYERARLAATAKSSPTSRRAGLPSQRRPWTTEEENALMAGLDRVKGPHWSQILAMFGPGGTINESLKDRNQVQLKDKARNLKLFFLKSGIEVPYYLKFVTGELKTRAPAQAAKNEAKERERKQGEEDKAHVEGIEGMMALAGAHTPHIAPGPEPDPQSESGSVPREQGSQPLQQPQQPQQPQQQPQHQQHQQQPHQQQPHQQQPHQQHQQPPPEQTEDQSVERTLMQSLGHEIKTEAMQNPPQFGVMDSNMQPNA